MKYETPDVEVVNFVAVESIAAQWSGDLTDDVGSNPEIVVTPTIVDWPDD